MPTGRQPTVVDLFAGAGGFSLGFASAGYRILAAVDRDEAAGETLKANAAVYQPDAPPEVFSGQEYGDIEHFDLEGLFTDPPDVLVGGPPCQGFSMIGRAKLEDLRGRAPIDDPRNRLYERYMVAVRAWRPAVVVVENVPGMLHVSTARGKQPKGAEAKLENVAERVVADIRAAGYVVRYALLNAAWFGVPQTRERIIIIGLRRDLGLDVDPAQLFPLPTHRVQRQLSGYVEPGSSDVQLTLFGHCWQDRTVEGARVRLAVPMHATPATTVREALDDLPVITDHLEGVPLPRTGFRLQRALEATPWHAYQDLMRQWPGLPTAIGVADHQCRRTPRDYPIFKAMRPWDSYPEAVAIAETRFEAAAAAQGLHPGNPKHQEALESLRKAIVPPYPVEKFRTKWRKLDPDRPSPTVPAHLERDTYSHIHYDSLQARTITPREAARLQSFPDAYQFAGNMGDVYRQVGNAVPPLFAWAVADALYNRLGHRLGWAARDIVSEVHPRWLGVSAISP